MMNTRQDVIMVAGNTVIPLDKHYAHQMEMLVNKLRGIGDLSPEVEAVLAQIAELRAKYPT